MINNTASRACWPAVGPRLERGVRQHCVRRPNVVSAPGGFVMPVGAQQAPPAPRRTRCVPRSSRRLRRWARAPTLATAARRTDQRPGGSTQFSRSMWRGRAQSLEFDSQCASLGQPLQPACCPAPPRGLRFARSRAEANRQTWLWWLLSPGRCIPRLRGRGFVSA